MRLPAYSSYKDSGVEWIGDIPTGWTVRRLKFLARVQTGIAKGKDISGVETVLVPYLRVANVQDGYIDLDDVSTIEVPVQDVSRYLLRPGDVLMNEGGDFDKLGRGQVWRGAIDPCIHQNHVFAVRSHAIEPEWLALVTSADCGRYFFMSRSKQSTNLASISSTNLLELPVPCPPSGERATIMAFLSSEIAKTDALVAEQERLMALLKEKRQAVISQAVTKGLDPNAKMKDSGVEWLGEVPAHWTVTRLKYVVRADGTGIQIGPFGAMLKDLPTEPSGFKLYGQQNVISGDFEAGDRWITEETFISNPSYQVRSGDLLVTRKGSLGNCRIVPVDVTQGWFDSDSICIRVDTSRIINRFLQLSLHEASYINRQIEETRRGAILSGINSTTVGNIWLLVPPLAQQRELLDTLDHLDGGFGALWTEAERAVALLKERRAALISAAVTGKIDVRDLIINPAEAA